MSSIQALSPDRENMIETRGLRRTFKSRQGTVEAVAGVDLRVVAGEVFGFLGPNGAGKTTTLRMLSTLLPPSGGEATVAGCDLRREPGQVRERIGYVGQRGGTDPQVSGRQRAGVPGAPLRDERGRGTAARRRVARHAGARSRAPTGPPAPTPAASGVASTSGLA